MSETRAVCILSAEEFADAVGAPRWTSAEVLRRLGLIHAMEWRAILRLVPTVRTLVTSININSSGIIERSSLDSGSGDSERSVVNRSLTSTADFGAARNGRRGLIRSRRATSE